MKNYDLYYEQLTIECGADEETIKKAYKKLALKFHPDKNQGDAAATKKFLEIGTAYEKLMKMLRGEESDDEDGGSWEDNDKEAELEMLRRELERERRKEKRRKEQERWEEEFKMQQTKKRMAREREEREEEFRMKEEQVKRERLIREKSMKQRNERWGFLRSASTSSCFFSAYAPPTTFSSYSSYTSEDDSPNYSYAAKLASKWSPSDLNEEEEEQDTSHVTESSHRNGDADENTNSESSSSFRSSYSGPGLSFTNEHTYAYTPRRKYNSDDPILATNHDEKDTTASSTDYLNPTADSAESVSEDRRTSFTIGERLSSRTFPTFPRSSTDSPSYRSFEHSEPTSTYLPFSSYRKTATDFTHTSPRTGVSEDQDSESTTFGNDHSFNHRSYESVLSSPSASSYSNNTSDYRHSRSSSRKSTDQVDATLSTESPSNLYDFSSFTSYLNSTPSPRYTGSRDTSPVSSRSDLLSPTFNTKYSHSANEEETYSETDNGDPSDTDESPYTNSRTSWSQTLPRRKISNRLQEQLDWEKQFFRETERRRKAREEEEARDAERLRLELQNQEAKRTKEALEKHRWESTFAANFIPSHSSYDDTNGGTYSRQYNFRNTNTEPPANNTSSYTSRYGSPGFTPTEGSFVSTSPDKLYRNVYNSSSPASIPEVDTDISFTPELI